MGMLEELMMRLGVSSPDYGRTGMDLSPEERKRLIEERMLGYKSDVGGMDLSPQLTPWGESLFGSDQDAAAGSIADRTAPKDQAVTALMDARRSAEEAAAPQRAADKIAELQRQTNQRSLDALTGGSGPDSGVSYPAGLLMAIRKQAALKGQAGSLGADVSADVTLDDYLQPNVGAGGSFSQGANTPELQARLAERDEWTAGQPERDLAFAVTPEQARRNPEYAASAADKLRGLRDAGTAERQVANQEALIEAVRGTGGKVPFEIANQLDVAGFTVPWPMRGMSDEQANAWLDQQDQAITGDIEGLMGGGPENVMGWAIYVKSVIATARKRIAGGEDRDAVLDWVKEQTQKSGDESGATQYAQQMLAAQEGQ